MSTRFRRDQLDDLAEVKRRLTLRGRWRRDRRITNVALVRVAVDVLLQHVDKLRGDTEEEIRESILLALRRGRCPDCEYRASGAGLVDPPHASTQPLRPPPSP